MNLEFFVKDKRITRKGLQSVVANTSGHYTFSITFDKEWDGLVKLVVFRNGKDTAQLIYTGQTWLPDNVSGRGDLYVACHGYKSLEDRTAVVRTVRMSRPVRIASAGPMAGDAPEIYSPTLLEQILTKLQQAEHAILSLTALRDRIAAMLENGELRGADGRAFVLRGRCDSLAQLRGAHPTGMPGDAWVVGSPLQNSIYFWSEQVQDWEPIGSLRGPEGPAGVSPHIGENGNWWVGSADTGVAAQPAVSWESLSDKPALFSGSYHDLSDKPSLFSGSYNDLSDVPTSFTPAAHSHAASKVTAGTFAGQVVANASGQAPGTSLLRNSKLVATEETPTVNGEIFWVYG